MIILVVYFSIYIFFYFCGGNSVAHLANMLINEVMEMLHYPENECYNTLESQQFTLSISYPLQNICTDLFLLKYSLFLLK